MARVKLGNCTASACRCFRRLPSISADLCSQHRCFSQLRTDLTGFAIWRCCCARCFRCGIFAIFYKLCLARLPRSDAPQLDAREQVYLVTDTDTAQRLPAWNPASTLVGTPVTAPLHYSARTPLHMGDKAAGQQDHTSCHRARMLTSPEHQGKLRMQRILKLCPTSLLEAARTCHSPRKHNA